MTISNQWLKLLLGDLEDGLVIKEDGGDINELSSNESSVLDKDNLNDWPDLVVIDGVKGN